MTPQRIAHYTVLRELGAGGMGVVYEVQDPALPRTLALKTVIAGQASTDAITRFLREAEALARVSHGNVIKVHDIGQWQDGHYLTMDLIPGKTVDDSVAHGGVWSGEQVAQLGSGLASALTVSGSACGSGRFGRLSGDRSRTTRWGANPCVLLPAFNISKA